MSHGCADSAVSEDFVGIIRFTAYTCNCSQPDMIWSIEVHFLHKGPLGIRSGEGCPTRSHTIRSTYTKNRVMSLCVRGVLGQGGALMEGLYKHLFTTLSVLSASLSSLINKLSKIRMKCKKPGKSRACSCVRESGTPK